MVQQRGSGFSAKTGNTGYAIRRIPDQPKPIRNASWADTVALAHAGFMPLAGVRDRDAARFVAIRSVAGTALF